MCKDYICKEKVVDFIQPECLNMYDMHTHTYQKGIYIYAYTYTHTNTHICIVLSIVLHINCIGLPTVHSEDPDQAAHSRSPSWTPDVHIKCFNRRHAATLIRLNRARSLILVAARYTCTFADYYSRQKSSSISQFVSELYYLCMQG